ncbi:SUN domain-containing protein 5 [Linum perenne]
MRKQPLNSNTSGNHGTGGGGGGGGGGGNPSLANAAVRCREINKFNNQKEDNIICCNHDNRNLRNGRGKRSLYELSLSFILLLWSFVFYTRLGLSHQNEGNSTGDVVSKTIPGPISSYRGNYSPDGMMLKFNYSASSVNNSPVHLHFSNCKCSIPKINRTEEVIRSFLGDRVLVCSLRSPEELELGNLNQLPGGKSSYSSGPYLNLDEFRDITKQDKGQNVPTEQANIAHRLEPDGSEYNFASAMKGAKVVAHNKEAKGAGNILGGDHDKYLRNPCSVGEKFVVIELSEETLVDVVKIANFEHYSSNFKDIVLYGSLNYPTNTWTLFGEFVAANVKQIQNFKLPEPKWARYLKLNLLSHYGTEFYCTLSVFEVHGVDAIDRMLKDLLVLSKESTPSDSPEAIEPPALKLESGTVSKEADNTGRLKENSDDGPQMHGNGVKSTGTLNEIPDPVSEVRQMPASNRIPSDTILKILMQKVRSLEVSLSLLEEYIKQLNRKQGDVLLEFDKELSRISSIVEVSRTELSDLTKWKEEMEKGLGELESWKDVVSTRLDTLGRENDMLRYDVQKVANDQANLENKEMAVLLVSLFFMCFAAIKLISAKLSKFLGPSSSSSSPSRPNKVHRTNAAAAAGGGGGGGWLMILVSSTMTIFITLLSS